MADLSNVDAALAERIRGTQNEAGQRGPVMVVTTGYRSYDEQLRLYNAMLQAQAKYGKKWQKYAALAAKPGTSMHELRGTNHSPQIGQHHGDRVPHPARHLALGPVLRRCRERTQRLPPLT